MSAQYFCNLQRFSLYLCLAICLSACNTMPVAQEPAETAQAELRFVDLQKFDRELYTSLSKPLPKVEVAFYNEVTPNTLPDRLQQWMAAVESGGGTVKIIPPKSSIQAKNPFMLFSLASTLWTASKTVKEMSNNSRFNKAQAYDALIQLKTDDKGSSVVDKVVFIKKQTQSQ